MKILHKFQLQKNCILVCKQGTSISVAIPNLCLLSEIGISFLEVYKMFYTEIENLVAIGSFLSGKLA